MLNPISQAKDRWQPSRILCPMHKRAALPHQQVQPVSKLKVRRRHPLPPRSKSRRTRRRGKLTFSSKEQFSNPFSSIVSTDSLSGQSNACYGTTCTPTTGCIFSFPQERRFLVIHGGGGELAQVGFA